MRFLYNFIYNGFENKGYFFVLMLLILLLLFLFYSVCMNESIYTFLYVYIFFYLAFFSSFLFRKNRSVKYFSILIFLRWQNANKYSFICISKYLRFCDLFIFRSSRPQVFFEKVFLRNFTKFTTKNMRRSLVFRQVAGLRPVFLLKKWFWHTYFPANFAKFKKARLLQSTSVSLVLSFIRISDYLWFCDLFFQLNKPYWFDDSIK